MDKTDVEQSAEADRPRKFGPINLSLPPAFRYREYRNYWFGMLSAVGGFQIAMFGQFWLIHELTGSTVYLGYVGLANAIPAIILNLAGGVVADRFDKQRLIIVTQTISASLVGLLAVITLAGVVEPWHVLTIAVFAGAINAFNQPARQSIYPYLIERKVMMSAVALNSSIWQGTRIIAPAIGGVLIAVIDTGAAFVLAAVLMFVFTIVVVFLKVPDEARAGASARKSSAFGDIVEGLKFIKANSVFSFLIAMTFFNSFFGLSYIILMPVFADDILKVGADGQGVLMSVSGVGALIVTLWLGTRVSSGNTGFILIGGAVLTGITLAAWALTAEYIGSYPLALFLIFFLGLFSSVYMISIMSTLQMLVPNEMRGRVMGFYGMTWNIMPLGGMFAGALAVSIGAAWAVAIGGLAVSAFAIGPALLNGRIRNLGELLVPPERAEPESSTASAD
ncbi:MAG: MFS transporter [Dehalococcoidia bacterium]